MAQRNNQNPFVDRFSGLTCPEDLRSRVDVPAVPIELHSGLETSQAVSAVEHALNDMYRAPSDHLELMFETVSRSKAYCEKAYTSQHDYVGRIYEAPENQHAEYSFPTCVTGLPGIGKSAMVKALGRLYKSTENVEVAPHHNDITLVGHWTITIKSGSTINQVLREKLQPAIKVPKQTPLEMINQRCRKVAYRDGVACIVLDEVQEAIVGARARNVAQDIITLGHLGLPYLFVTNYSFCNALMGHGTRKPAVAWQARQRILSHPVLLLPSPPDSEDWCAYLTEISTIFGPALKIDLAAENRLIFQYSAGLKRLVNQLLTGAVKSAWSSGRAIITMSDVQQYYDSTAYSANRNDVEKVLSSFTGRARDFDYQSPFPPPQKTAAAYEELARKVAAEKRNAVIQAAALGVKKRSSPQAPQPTTLPQKPSLSTPSPAESAPRSRSRRSELTLASFESSDSALR